MAINNAFLLSLLGLVLWYLVLYIFLFLKRVWWNPIQVSRAMEAQGIRGPPYRFVYGNNKEIAEMIRESMRRSMDRLSDHNIVPRIHPHLHAWIKTYGRILLKWQGASPQLVVNEPDMIKEILANREGVYLKSPPSVWMKNFIGDGLLTTQGKKWNRQRKLANQSFRGDNLKAMIHDMVESVEDMLKKWEDCEGKEVNLFEEFTVLTCEIIARTAFGSSYINGKNIFKRLNELGLILARNFQTIRFPFARKIWPSQDDIESDIGVQEIRESIIRIMKQREEQQEGGDLDGYGSDFLGSLIKAYHDKDKDARISLDDIIDECKTFFAAGQETSTSLLTWTGLLLAINPDWQDKARKEVIELFGQSNPTSDDTRIAKLKTVTMILNESLRLYPPALVISRMVAREVKLGKLILPAGMELLILPLVVHHDPKLWGEDSHLFKPERFIDGLAGATSNPAAFIPFGSGRRSCVGQNFAMLEAKVALVMILQRFSFTPSPAYVHAPAQRLTNQPQHGLQVMLHKI